MKSKKPLKNLRKLRRLITGSMLGIFIFWIYMATPAQALNGNTVVVPCSPCGTSATFQNGALVAARARFQANGANPTGLYEVVSGSQASTAYVRVTGTIQTGPHGGPNVFLPSGMTSVDSNGNPLTGTEAQMEAYYGTLDQTIFGSSRSSTPGSVNVPDTYTASFINSSEEEVSPGIGRGLVLAGVNEGAIPAGTPITAKFKDGTSALYNKAPAYQSSYQWTWSGIAYDGTPQHRQMNRNGTPVGNKNTAGVGTGSFSAPGYGSAAPYTFGLVATNFCVLTATATIDGTDYTFSSFVIPC